MHFRAITRILLFVTVSLVRAGAAPANETAGLGAKAANAFHAGPAEAAARYASPDWVMLWHDEFDRGTMVSPEKWAYEVGRVRNNEAQYYTEARPENARVADGDLIVTGRREPWKGADYTSASVTTRGKFAFTYGKVEIRAQIPTGRGTWPALWLLGDTKKYGWPECGEIDLMENVGFDPQKIHFTTHTGAFNHVIGTQRGYAVVLPHPWAEFHRYGLIWTPQRLEYFLDGEKVSEFVNDGQGHSHWPFDAPMYLIVNLALGGGWGGQQGIDTRIFPVEYRIDYVRVWQAPKK